MRNGLRCGTRLRITGVTALSIRKMGIKRAYYKFIPVEIFPRRDLRIYRKYKGSKGST
jgi:hypothetical protein